MKNYLIVVLSLVTFLFFPTTGVHAEITEITFASESWVQATEKDGSGLYWDIFRAVFEPVGIKVKPLARSYDASVRMVEAQKVDAMVGAYTDEIENGIYPKHHFAIDVVDVLGKKGSMASWQGQNTLENKKVGWIKGYAYDEYLDVKVFKKTYDKRESAFRNIDKGKIDYFIDAKGDLDDFFNSGKADREQFEIKTLLKLKLFTVFAKNEKGQTVAKIFDQRFSELLKSGEIQKLYDDYIMNKQAAFTNPF